jgi:hypothetical protein
MFKRLSASSKQIVLSWVIIGGCFVFGTASVIAFAVQSDAFHDMNVTDPSGVVDSIADSYSIADHADLWLVARSLDRYRDCGYDIRHINHGLSNVFGTGFGNAAKAQVSGRYRFHLSIPVSLSIDIHCTLLLIHVIDYLSYHPYACQVSVPHCGAKNSYSTIQTRKSIRRF